MFRLFGRKKRETLKFEPRYISDHQDLAWAEGALLEFDAGGMPELRKRNIGRLDILDLIETIKNNLGGG